MQLTYNHTVPLSPPQNSRMRQSALEWWSSRYCSSIHTKYLHSLQPYVSLKMQSHKTSAIIPLADWGSQGTKTSTCTGSLPLTVTHNLQS